MTAWQIAETHGTDARAHKTFRVVTNFEKHAANLAINALSQDDAQSRRSDGMQSCDLRSLAVEKDAAQQFRRVRRVPWSIQSHFVFFLDLVARMGEVLCEIAVVRENEKSFALRIQPADVKEPWKFRRQKIEDRVARMRIAF